MKNNNPVIVVLLKPEDVKDVRYLDHEDCAVSRACKRHFKSKHVVTGEWDVKIDGKTYEILNDGFGREDLEKVKKEYALGPKRKWDHYVEIQEI